MEYLLNWYFKHLIKQKFKSQIEIPACHFYSRTKISKTIFAFFSSTAYFNHIILLHLTYEQTFKKILNIHRDKFHRELTKLKDALIQFLHCLNHVKRKSKQTDLWAGKKKADINNTGISKHLRCKYHLCLWLTDSSICIFVQKARLFNTEKTTTTGCRKIVNIIRNFALGKKNFCEVEI